MQPATFANRGGGAAGDSAVHSQYPLDSLTPNRAESDFCALQPAAPPLFPPKYIPAGFSIMKSTSALLLLRSRLRSGVLVLASLVSCAFAATARAQTPVLQINAGAGAVSPFVADEYYSAGNEFTSTATINTSGVTSPAPTAV